MTTALDHIEFLARSPHRVEVLEALADAPRTRHDLRDRADVSRITIRRMLEDFEDRGWVRHDDGQYEATPRGRYVAAEFTRLHGNVEAVEDLQDAVSWLPVEQFGFDLWHLRDADVTSINSWSDHKDAIECVADFAQDANRLWGITSGFTHEVLAEITAKTVDGPASFEAVITPSAIEMARADDEMRDNLRAVLDAECNDVRRYDSDDLALIFIVGDESVVLCGHSDHGPPPGTVETENDAVRAWLRSHFESLHAQAEPIGGEVLAPDRAGEAEFNP